MCVRWDLDYGCIFLQVISTFLLCAVLDDFLAIMDADETVYVYKFSIILCSSSSKESQVSLELIVCSIKSERICYFDINFNAALQLNSFFVETFNF